MNKHALTREIFRKKSFLCVGLDSDIEKIPSHLLGTSDPVFEFNKAIIDATKDLCVSYKLNTAFYESRGIKGWKSLEKTLNYIPENIFTIADAKRGDIGNTASHYAKTFFETFPFDAVTLSPYMGEDSIAPFLSYTDKWVILLGLTSNKGAADFQLIETVNHKKVYQEVLEISSSWGSAENMIYVAGATRPEQISDIREILPDHFLLVPGIGAQGGSLEQTAQHGMTADCGLLINSSREIIFADSSEQFATKAGEKAANVQQQMANLLPAR